MSIRFLADFDLDFAIVRGTRLREPAIDFLSSAEADLEGISDPEVLRIAADAGRVLVSHDKKTLPGHFVRFLREGRESPGVFLARQDQPIGDIIEALATVWSTSEAAEWVNQIVYLPSLERHGFR